MDDKSFEQLMLDADREAAHQIPVGEPAPTTANRPEGSHEAALHRQA